MLRLVSGGQGRHPDGEGTRGLATGLLHTAIIISGDGIAVAPSMMMAVMPAATIVVAAGQLLPGVRRGGQRRAGAHGPGHVWKIRRAQGEGAHRVCMSTCDRCGHEAEMKECRFHGM